MKYSLNMELVSLEELLEAKLPTYAEWRGRWPLWTGDSKAWSGEAWADRIHWSLWLRLNELGRGLQGALPPEYKLLNPLTQSGHFVAWRAGNRPDASSFPLPELYRLRVLAASAQFARSIPTEAEEIEIPRLDAEGVPSSELEDLSSQLVRKLTTQTTGTGALVTRLARHHQLRGQGRQAEVDTEVELAVELARQLSVTVERRGTTKQTISPPVLESLREEIREVVAEVQDWMIPDNDLIGLGRLLSADRQLRMKRNSDPDTWLSLVDSDRERRREQGLQMGRRSWVGTEARQLAFPFLFREEIEACLRDDQTTAKVADELLLRRLPAEITRSTLASLISRAT